MIHSNHYKLNNVRCIIVVDLWTEQVGQLPGRPTCVPSDGWIERPGLFEGAEMGWFQRCVVSSINLWDDRWFFHLHRLRKLHRSFANDIKRRLLDAFGPVPILFSLRIQPFWNTSWGKISKTRPGVGILTSSYCAFSMISSLILQHFCFWLVSPEERRKSLFQFNMSSSDFKFVSTCGDDIATPRHACTKVASKPYAIASEDPAA